VDGKLQAAVAKSTIGPADASHASDRGARRLLTGGWLYVWLVVVSLVVSALSLSFPSTPSYDPWSWLIWGREIVHGTLSLQASGSSWKPMPMVFTTIFALFGGSSPYLWLLVARAGYVLTVLMALKLSFRLTLALGSHGALGALGSHGADRDAAAGHSVDTPRWLRLAPAVLSSIVAAICIALTRGFPGDALVGYSEAVALGFMMIAAERAADGHHRQAFALLLFVVLNRPESWVVWLPYGAWLMWHDRRTRALVITLVVLALAAWFIPTHIGGESAAGRALTSRGASSAANSSFPFWQELHTVEWGMLLTRVKIFMVCGLIVALWQLWRLVRASGPGLRRRWRWRPAERHEWGLLGYLGIGAFGVGWWLLVAAETQVGFAGNPRYAMFGSAAVSLCGGVGFGWAATALARFAGRQLERRQRASIRLRRWLPAPATGLLALVFLLVPGWVGSTLPSVSSIRSEARYEARTREEIQALVATNGGAAALLRCGTVIANNYQVPEVAWYLDVPTSRIAAATLTASSVLPNVVFQTGSSYGVNWSPTNDQVGYWIERGANFRITVTDPVIFYKDCGR
jgi:hypothetical protein